VVGAEPAQLAFALCDLAVELVDQTQARMDRGGPGLRQRQPLKERTTGDAEEGESEDVPDP
jgi:hypothetical protein